ncbi:MAG: PP2C family serine/threonine-protein phosphatase [Pyrinomonadaceae bacterium]
MISAKQAANNNLWRAAFASVTGTGHERKGIVCQDAASIKTSGNALAACVCDGAGSARLSHIGAKAVAEAVSQLLVKQRDAIFADEWSGEAVIDAAHKAINTEIKRTGGKPKDYACTLVALLITRDKFATFHLGDGLIAAVDEGIPKVISAPVNGEFINEVVFVTSSNAYSQLRTTISSINPLLTSFALITDGSQASLYSRQTNTISQVIEQMASWLDRGTVDEVSRSIESVIREHFLERTQDDCTVVVIRRNTDLQRFACPACGRWTLRRSGRGKKNFQAKCEVCDEVKQFPGISKRAYPPDAREWAEHLASNMSLGLPKVRDITGIPAATLRRWLKRRLRKKGSLRGNKRTRVR